MKKYILIYGLCGGVLIAVLKFIEYRFLVLQHSVEIYGGLIALVFVGLGIGLGLKLTKKKEVVVVKEVPVTIAGPFALNEERLRELGVTKRELEILELIAQGMSNREIAEKLFRKREHSEDSLQPAVRQIERKTQNAGRADWQGTWLDSLERTGAGGRRQTAGGRTGSKD